MSFPVMGIIVMMVDIGRRNRRRGGRIGSIWGEVAKEWYCRERGEIFIIFIFFSRC